VRFATEEFLAMISVNENRGPPSGTWISETRAVRYELNFFQSVIHSLEAAKPPPKHFCIFLFYFSTTCYIIENGRINNMATKKAAKKAAPKKAAKKAAKKK
jgi:hypothetical protein